MALSLSTTRSAAGLSRQPAPTRRRVCAPPPRAGLADVFAPILKIFSKADDAVSTGNTGFSGSISHHGAGKPFKDGYANTSAAAKAAAQQDDESSTYLGEAVQRVVNNNFTGDDTEPPAGSGASGWKGSIHDRTTGDGFHSRKL